MKQEIANIIQLPKIFDPRGNLTVAEEQKNIPFHIKHVEWRYGMPAGTSLEPDAHHPKLVFIALSGSFTIEIKDGESTDSFFLNHPYQGLYLAENVEFKVRNCSNGAVILQIS